MFRLDRQHGYTCMARVYIETYGCALNHGDTYIMKTVLARRGHSIVDDIALADTIIINTCTVRMETEQRMLYRIKNLYNIALNTGKKLIVAGCLAKAEPYVVSKIAPNASLVSPQNVSKIYIAVESPRKTILLQGERDRNILGVWMDNRIGIIPIQEGCLGNCSFCIVKNARRKLVSYPINAVVDTVKKLVEKGAVEIELTGQDTAAYGLDLYSNQVLPELLKKIVELPGNYMVRIGMMNPDTLRPILDKLINIIKHPRIYKFLHIPLQSGSNKVLKIMNRRYTVEEYMEIVKELRRKVPGIAIATDIIVGHPGEDDEDFNETLNVLRELEIDRVHVAQYTIRPNTLSAKLPQISSKVKKKRMKRILEVIDEIGRKKHSIYYGKIVTAFTTEYYKGNYVGRLVNYTPVIIMNSTDNLAFGKWVKVRVIDYTFYDLRGEVIE